MGTGAGGGSLPTQRNFFCPLGKDDRCPLALGEGRLEWDVSCSEVPLPSAIAWWPLEIPGVGSVLLAQSLDTGGVSSRPMLVPLILIFHTVTLSEFFPDEMTHRSG